MSHNDDSKIGTGRMNVGWTYVPLNDLDDELIVNEDEIVNIRLGDHWDPSNWHRWMDEPLARMLQLSHTRNSAPSSKGSSS